MEKFLENFLLKTTTKIILDCLMLLFSYALIIIMKYDNNWHLYIELKDGIVLCVIGFIIFSIRKTNYKSWSYLNTNDILSLGLDILFINFIYFLYLVFGDTTYSIYLIIGNIVFGCFLLFNQRFIIRVLINRSRSNNSEKSGKKTIIVGAGSACDTLLREYKKNGSLKFQILGLIDDNPKKSQLILHNYRVLGNRFDIPKLVQNLEIEQVIIAIPSTDRKNIQEIYDLSTSTGVQVKILPSYNDILETESFASQLRDVEVEDLLGRDVVEVNTKIINKYIENKVIFVTGGAGSIGSELSRQIARFNPKLLINIDINENSLYFLELEIKRNFPNVKIISEVCNIREKEKLDYLFNKYKPNLVYHAAAHKHVPLMEHNPEEAIKNNIFGSKNVLDLADKYDVEKFVLISTDKAVNPTNIMGATKRATELLLEDVNKRSKTKFMAVRFGNVLGSNGSVIPIFKNLIKERKNLTVTHPDITRYFMTIPEAAQLVLEAGGIGNGGEVFVLDMGEPVKIVDLAKNLIKLSGLILGIDIEIEITGLRPGEKLYEELLYDVNNAEKTENKKIFIAKLKNEETNVAFYLEELSEILKNKEFFKLKEMLKKLVVTYKEPAHHKINA